MKKALSIVLVLVLTVLLAACGNAGKGTAHANEVTIIIPNDVMSLDPGQTSSDTDFFMNYACVYEGLTAITPENEIAPNLAEKWDISDDGLTYTFYLKKGVKFHNGEDFKASDVVFSYNYAKETPYLATFGELFTSVKALDDYTVEVVLPQPFSPFLSQVAGAFIYSEKAVNELGDKYGLNPVGTGPFKFESYALGDKVVFTRFDDYHKGPAKIEKVTFKIIADNNTALLALESGDVDYILTAPQIAYDNLEKNKDINVFQLPTRELFHVTMNFNKKPFDDIRVRQALNYAINKQDVINMAVEGFGEVATYPMNSMFFHYSKNVKGYDYNEAKAKELLAEAGYPEGFTCTLDTCDNFKKVAETVQEQLGRVGIKCEMRVSDQNAMMENVSSDNYEIAVFMWVLDAEADSWKYIFETGNVVNYAPYSNAKVDELFAKAAASTDQAEVDKMYDELFQQISDDAVMVPIFHGTKISAANANLNIPHFDIYGYPVVYELSWK